MKGTLLVKNVKHLVTCDGDDRLLDGVDVFIGTESLPESDRKQEHRNQEHRNQEQRRM